MSTIRRLNFWDSPKLKKMIFFLESGENLRKDLMSEAFRFVHRFFPLKYRFMPESYILLEGKEILGLVTVAPTLGNPFKLNITRLVFDKNFYDAGKQLIEFVTSKYAAKGAVSFTVAVDQCHDELINLFINGCGFRHCSYENLWKLSGLEFPEKVSSFRYFQNSDAPEVAELYNGEVIDMFKNSLKRAANEFKEPFFEGITNFYKNRYVLEDSIRRRIIAYMSMTTSDNLNYIIDLTQNSGYDFNYDEILGFAIREIARRKTVFYPFVKQKQYTKAAGKFEDYLHAKNCQCIQTQLILVKDFYRPVKQEQNALQVFLFGENRITAN